MSLSGLARWRCKLPAWQSELWPAAWHKLPRSKGVHCQGKLQHQVLSRITQTSRAAS